MDMTLPPLPDAAAAESTEAAIAAALAAAAADLNGIGEPTPPPPDLSAAQLAMADQTAMETMAQIMDEAHRENDARRPAEEIYQRIGLLTRTLHNALRELGYDKQLSDVQKNLPDARDRLTYIARVTGEAAEKVLNGVDRARTVQDDQVQRAASLRTRWMAVSKFMSHGERATPAGQSLVEETCLFFDSVGGQADATNAILTDIMMAQDFHDLTGQVIRKVVTLATTLEEQLVKILLEATPPELRVKVESPPALEGPVVNYEKRSDVVADQAGVDDLLASLGF